jgi:hypothetical protein
MGRRIRFVSGQSRSSVLQDLRLITTTDAIAERSLRKIGGSADLCTLKSCTTMALLSHQKTKWHGTKGLPHCAASKESGHAALKENGHAAIEVALLAPWIVLLFIAIFNFGFYAYAAICTQNAARVAALATASAPETAASQSVACSQALEEMRMLPNVAGLAPSYGCGALPLRVNVVGSANASRVEVTYQTVQLFPLPFLMGRMTLTRIANVRVFGE